jgi:hypothetical protein
VVAIDNAIAEIVNVEVNDSRKYVRIIADFLKTAAHILALFPRSYAVTSKTALSIGNELENKHNAKAKKLLQTLWESEPTFYDRIFRMHGVVGSTDAAIIAITLSMLRNTLETVDIDPTNPEEDITSQKNLLERILALRAERRDKRNVRDTETAIAHANWIELTRQHVKRRIDASHCTTPERARRDELNRQHAIRQWADHMYIQMLRYLNKEMQADPWLQQTYKEKLEKFLKAYPIVHGYMKGGKQSPELLRYNDVFKKWVIDNASTENVETFDPFRVISEEIPSIFKKVPARDTWTILYRHLVFMQVRGLLDDFTVKSLIDLDQWALNNVFGTFASDLSQEMKNCIQHWAKAYAQNLYFINDGMKTRRYQYSVIRLKEFEKFLKDVILTRQKHYNYSKELTKEELFFLYPPTMGTDDLQRFIIRDIKACINCGADALLQCGGCLEAQPALYCGIECQRQDWIDHGQQCPKAHLK